MPTGGLYGIALEGATRLIRLLRGQALIALFSQGIGMGNADGEGY